MSALKSVSDIPRIHGGRRLASRERSSSFGGSPTFPFVGDGGKLVVENPLVAKLASSGRGSWREKSWRGPLVKSRGRGGRTTVGLFVTPSGLTLAPSTG